MRQAAVACGLAMGMLWPVVAEARGRKPLDPNHPVTKALAFFELADADSGEGFLRQRRPAPPSPAFRARVLATLPSEGALQPTAEERTKLAALDPVFELHQRKG